MIRSKPKRQRDYKAEYRRRVERGQSKGLSRSQSRGHPKAKEKNVRKPRPISDASLQISLQALRSGKTLAEAAKEIRVSPERLRNQAQAKGIIKRRGRKWVIKNNIRREILIFSQGEAIKIVVGTLHQASKAGRYMAAAGNFLRSNNAAYLQPFIKESVTDAKGKKHPFETNPNALYRIAAGTDTFEQIYRIVT
jgi:hypothetical protein